MLNRAQVPTVLSQVVYYGCDNAVWFAKNKVFEIDASALGKRASIFWCVLAVPLLLPVVTAHFLLLLCPLQDTRTDCKLVGGFDRVPRGPSVTVHEAPGLNRFSRGRKCAHTQLTRQQQAARKFLAGDVVDGTVRCAVSVVSSTTADDVLLQAEMKQSEQQAAIKASTAKLFKLKLSIIKVPTGCVLCVVSTAVP